jgi:hypothetical protein
MTLRTTILFPRTLAFDGTQLDDYLERQLRLESQKEIGLRVDVDCVQECIP